MKTMTWCAIAVGLVACGVAFGQIGGTTSGDPRVKRVLDSLGYKYSITKQHNFALVFNVGNGRSQLVTVNSGTEKYKSFEIREIHAVCYRSKTRLTVDQLRTLLKDSGDKKLGAWSVYSNDDVDVAIFTVKAAAELSDEDMGALITLVTESADEMELKLTGTDDQ